MTAVGLSVPKELRASGMIPLDNFPLPVEAQYNYRSGFTKRHRGVDIFAPKGTPIVAVETGRACSAIEPKGGRVVYLIGVSGWHYFYGHLSAWELPVTRGPETDGGPRGVVVTAGEKLGKVGNSGNAKGTPSHVHFQARKTKTPVDPYDALREVDPHVGPPGRRRVSEAHNIKGGLAIAALLLWWASTQ